MLFLFLQFKPKINKMKSILAFILLITSSFLTAQTKQELSVGIGPSFFGWGDITGAALTATYNYQFAKHFGIEPRLISSSAWRTENNPYGAAGSGYNFDQTGYFGMAASFVYTPFKERGSFLKIKSGFLAGKMAHSYGGMSNGIPQTEYVDFSNETLLGLIHTVHFRILNREKFFFGTEISMLTSFSEGYYNCDGFVWNFMGGIKF
jgi:opacity protein-like surface antigen